MTPRRKGEAPKPAPVMPEYKPVPKFGNCPGC